jgi:hypothetical protein
MVPMSSNSIDFVEATGRCAEAARLRTCIEAYGWLKLECFA